MLFGGCSEDEWVAVRVLNPILLMRLYSTFDVSFVEFMVIYEVLFHCERPIG